MDAQRLGLADTVGVVRKRIEQIRERKEAIGEQNTKAALIDPVLAALGWDLQDIDEVRREYRRKSQDCPVDYALFLNRSECLLIEAKSLEKDLNDRKWISQNLGYATVAGVRWCVLTNGDEYRIYNSHETVDADEKLFRSVRLSDTTQPKLLIDTLRLLSKEQMRGRLLDELWEAEFVDRNVRVALEGLFGEENPSLVRLVAKHANRTPTEVRASLKRAKIRIDFPVVSPALPPAGASGNTSQRHSNRRREAGKKAWATMVAMSEAKLTDLIAAGMVRPPLKLEREYKGVHLEAVVERDGKVRCDGQSYDSLSTAAGMARKSVIGAPPDRPYPQTNGWTFWLYRDDATSELKEIDQLRRSFLTQQPR